MMEERDLMMLLNAFRVAACVTFVVGLALDRLFRRLSGQR